MKYFIFCLYDIKTRLFGNLLLFATREEAFRYFKFIVREDKNRLVSLDLHLYYIGDFNSSTGCIKSTDVEPELVMTANDVMSEVDNG